MFCLDQSNIVYGNENNQRSTFANLEQYTKYKVGYVYFVHPNDKPNVFMKTIYKYKPDDMRRVVCYLCQSLFEQRRT